MRRLCTLVTLSLLLPCVTQAVTFNFLTHPSLVGQGAGPDRTWDTADDEDWSALGMNPHGAITYFEFSNPAEFGVVGPDPAVIGFATGSFTIESAAGDQVIYGANHFTSLASDFTYNTISDRASQTATATNLPGQNVLHPGVSQLGISPPPFQIYSGVSRYGDPVLGPTFVSSILGSYLLAGQDPFATFDGVFGDPVTEAFLVDAWNYLLPMLPAGWTFAGAEFQDFHLDGLPGVVAGRLTTAFYSTDDAALPIFFQQSDVPEPVTLGLLVGGLGVLALRRKSAPRMRAC
jgi:hypothetical protein